MSRMENKVIDFLSYKIEKTLRKNGFSIKKDEDRNVKLLLKITKK
jgi:hypothetical protein